MITWDEPKRHANLDKHGIDFSVITADFFLNARILSGHSGRYRAIGYLDGDIVVAVVFKILGMEAVSIVSARRAGAKERKLLDG